MIYFSFLLIVLGAAAVLVSLAAVIYRVVNMGGWPRGDVITNRWVKIGLSGVGAVLLGQIIVALAL